MTDSSRCEKLIGIFKWSKMDISTPLEAFRRSSPNAWLGPFHARHWRALRFRHHNTFSTFVNFQHSFEYSTLLIQIKNHPCIYRAFRRSKIETRENWRSRERVIFRWVDFLTRCIKLIIRFQEKKKNDTRFPIFSGFSSFSTAEYHQFVTFHNFILTIF